MDDNHAASIIQEYAKRYICSSFKDAEICSFVECPVCIESGSWGIKLACSHTFHIGCLCRWMQCERSCPMCRAPFEDKRVTQLERDVQSFSNYLRLPIETLLDFQSAIPRHLFDTSNVVTTSDIFFTRAMKFSKVLDETLLLFIENRCKILADLRKQIALFDRKAASINSMSPDDLIVASIQHRICLSFETIYARVKDTHREFSILKPYNSRLVKLLRNRLCNLWSIEKQIEIFNSLSTNSFSSRAIVPVMNRRFSLPNLNSLLEIQTQTLA